MQYGTPLHAGTSTAHRLLSKKRLAAHLGRSTRWIDRRMREGMPRVDSISRRGRRKVRFRPGDVAVWLEARASLPKRKRRHRVAVLSAQVMLLSGRVDELSAEVEALWMRVEADTPTELPLPNGENLA
jgi:predicted DNA-binding transcriptional regulator AlpA